MIMKKLAKLFSFASRQRVAKQDQFESRLQSMGKPQPSKRLTRVPRPVLFRRTALE